MEHVRHETIELGQIYRAIYNMSKCIGIVELRMKVDDGHWAGSVRLYDICPCH